MAEYIKRKDALGVVLIVNERQRIKEIPAADVAPVRHGKWVKAHWKNSVSCANCSICGFEAYHYDFQGVQKTYNYCPNCGARMDEEEQQWVK